MAVYVVGSVNGDLTLPVERLPAPGATVLGRDPVRSGGGKGANVAVAAARDGRRVRLVAATGDDDVGERNLIELREEEVDTRGVAVLQGVATGLAVICVEASGENFIVVAPGANGCLTPELVTSGLADMTAADVCVVSFEIPEDAVAAAARIAVERGTSLLVNPSPVHALGQKHLQACPTVVANVGELRELTGQEEVALGAQRLLAQGCATIVVTMGGDGAYVASAHAEPGRVEAFPAAAVDTTGAGDAFTGLFAGAIDRGCSVEEAAHRAAAGAALSTEQIGARSAMPRTAEIDRMMRSG